MPKRGAGPDGSPLVAGNKRNCGLKSDEHKCKRTPFTKTDRGST